MKYYPARLAGTYQTVEEALRSAGFNDQQIKMAISNAAINQSDEVFVLISSDKGLVATKLPGGGVGLWQACVDLLCDTPHEALRYAKKMDANLGHLKGSTWAAFSWRAPLARSSH